MPLQGNWTLDGVGNWKQVDTETRQHSSFNEITQRNKGGATSILSDHNGNQADDGTHLFKWDYQNRLRNVSRKSDGATIAVYSYDALGRRIRKVVTNSGAINGTTDFYMDDWQELEERNAADTLVQQYVYGINIDEPLVLDRNLDGDNSAIGPGDQRLFYHQNTLFSVFALTDRTGKIVEGYQYDAYGRQAVYKPGPTAVINFGGDDIVTPSGLSALGNPYIFTGRRYDPETSQHYYRTRYLDTIAGRFVTRDTIGVWGDRVNLGNAYAYVGNRPETSTDPSGMSCTDECDAPGQKENKVTKKTETTIGKTPKEEEDALKAVEKLAKATAAGKGGGKVIGQAVNAYSKKLGHDLYLDVECKKCVRECCGFMYWSERLVWQVTSDTHKCNASFMQGDKEPQYTKDCEKEAIKAVCK